MVGIGPDSIADVFVVESIEEALLGDVVHSVEQVGAACIGVESDVELGGDSGGLARCVDVTQGDHGGLGSEKRGNQGAVRVNLHDGVAHILETVCEGGHVS